MGRLLMKMLPGRQPEASSASISVINATGSITTPLPMTAFPGAQDAAGISFRTNFSPPIKTVWPALLPPWLRATMSNFRSRGQ